MLSTKICLAWNFFLDENRGLPTKRRLIASSVLRAITQQDWKMFVRLKLKHLNVISSWDKDVKKKQDHRTCPVLSLLAQTLKITRLGSMVQCQIQAPTYLDLYLYFLPRTLPQLPRRLWSLFQITVVHLPWTNRQIHQSLGYLPQNKQGLKRIWNKS